MQLRNKTIIILSPQAWGQMFLSKHHYAITLARQGNKVFFLNPPKQGRLGLAGDIKIAPSNHQNLFIVEHTIGFPSILRFHRISLFHWFMKYHIKNLLKKINRPVDIIWSFDQLHLYPFKFFDKPSFKIFQPVDEPSNKNAIDAAHGCDIILSVTNEILSRYTHFKKPMHLINHGIDEDFLMNPFDTANKKNIHVGFSGNLLRKDIDRDTFLQIVRANPSVVFECWGSYKAHHTNIGGSESLSSQSFIDAIKQHGVILHGPVTSSELAKGLNKMDAFLICYDVNKDPSGGTNYHKIIEYLSTGKVIISNNVTSYKNQPELVQMVEERESNKALPALFTKVIDNLNFYNNQEFQKHRKEFARTNTYAKQVERIQVILGEKLW
jgi:glycosyltransferase involved in cell wall biosynthesis